MSTDIAIHVAVAVIHYNDEYLIGYRNHKQHQGNRYEFIGGKVEVYETPKQALIREVQEEIGLDISDSSLTNNHVNTIDIEDISKLDREGGCSAQGTSCINKLGRLIHDYGDKQVVLHVFRVSINKVQFAHWQHITVGALGQPVKWVSKQALIRGEYPLPKANDIILQWLSLPARVSITYSIQVADEGSIENACSSWLNYHKVYLTADATVYVRHQLNHTISEDTDTASVSLLKLIADLAKSRPDLKLIIGCREYKNIQNFADSNRKHKAGFNSHNLIPAVIAQHLTQYELMTLDNQLMPYLGYLKEHSWMEHSWIQQAGLSLIRADYSNSAINNTMSPNTQRKYDHLSEPIDKATILTKLRSILASLLSINTPITCSCHDSASVMAVNRLALVCKMTQFSTVIATFISPVKDTLSHPNARGMGWQKFNELADLADMPVIALGGLSPNDLAKVRTYNGDKIAGIRQFMGDDDSARKFT